MEVCELTDIDLPDQGQDQVEKVYAEIVARIDTDESLYQNIQITSHAQLKQYTNIFLRNKFWTFKATKMT